GTDDNTSDYISEGLMRSVLSASKTAIHNPSDYTARSNLMWTASWALNSLIGLGKKGDWMVHKMGHAIGAWTNASHGMTLSSIVLPYYHFVLPYGLARYRRFAMSVFDVAENGHTDLEIAEEGLNRMEEWMRSLGLVMNPADLGVTYDMLDGIANSTVLLDAGYKKLERQDVRSILESAMHWQK
ncbi:MAG: iron-containing alcohol dehydrogenase, partial [Desulfovibrionaceae bacterium]|nr:iron-containing alcohol dehydrogenase [Desulfovibrionaceae bacterium]